MKSQKVLTISLGMVKVFVVQGDQTILIDTGTPNKHEKILGALLKHDVKPEDISLIVLTHNHSDHVGSVNALKQKTGAQVAIHKSEAEALARGESAKVKATGLLGKCMMKFYKEPDIQGIKPDLLVEEELKLHEFGVNGKLIHTPGHTSGSLSVLLDDGEMIVGDLLNGRGNRATKPMFATDLEQLKVTLKQIVKLSPTIIHTSHASSCRCEAIERLIARS